MSVTALDFDGGLVLLDGRGNRLLAYNESAALIWHAQARGQSPGAALADAFGIARAQAEADAAAIIAHWRKVLEPDAAPVAQVSASAAPALAPSACYELRGHVFAVSADDDGLLAAIDGVLGPRRCEPRAGDTHLVLQSAADGEIVLHVDGVQRLRSRDGGEISGAVFQAMLEALHGPDWLAIIHGAGVFGGDGALVLAGASGSGKSTLAAYLSATGWRPAADDMAAVLPDGRLVPWPVARSLKQGSWDVLREILPGLDAAPDGRKGDTALKYLAPPIAAWDEAPMPVRALVFPRYAPGAACGVTPLAPLEALQRLLQDRLWIGYPLQRAAVERFLAWLGDMPACELVYDDLAAAADALRRWPA